MSTDPEQIRHYLQEIQDRYDTITAFFVSDATRNYYHPTGIVKQIDVNDPEAAPPGSDAALALANDGSVLDTVVAAPADAPPPVDAGVILDGAAPTSAVSFESAPAPKVEAVGPCPK